VEAMTNTQKAIDYVLACEANDLQNLADDLKKFSNIKIAQKYGVKLHVVRTWRMVFGIKERQ